MNSPITCLADIEQIETTPLADRNLPRSTYDAIRSTAELHPEKLAIRLIENGEVWAANKAKGETALTVDMTYAEFLAGIHSTANLFRSLGVGHGDVVSMLLPNIPEAHCVLWGGEASGIVNPINYMLEAEEIGAIVQSAGTKVLVIMGKHDVVDTYEKLAVIRAAAPCVEHILVVGVIPEDADGCLSYDEMLKQQNSTSLDFEAPSDPDQIASLFHTGGTTGLPKLAQHTHKNEVYNSWAINQLLLTKPGDCLLTGLPLFHCNAAIASGLAAFSRGGTMILAGITGFRSAGIVQNLYAFIEHYRVVNFTAVPTIFAVLTQLPAEQFDLSSVRTVGCGAAPMPVELFHKFEKLTGVQTGEGYGLTEATVVSTMTPPDADVPRIGSVGLRLPYTHVKAAIVDADGNFVRDCKTDEVGTVLISGPSVTPGYTDQSKNAALFVTGADGEKWLNTGDLARQDADGYFWLTGRAKELIIRGGHNIDPKIIEEALVSHPAVNLAAAVGRPDSYAGEVPVAYVDTVAEVTPEELLAHCQERIGERAAIPKAITILDSLPVTGVGKTHKPTLHLMELELVVKTELAALAEYVEAYEVSAKSDTKLGNVAHITATCCAGKTSEECEAKLREVFGAYTFAFNLTVNA